MILVTGDIVLDHNVYEGSRLAPDAPAGHGAYYRPITGGAMLIHELLHALNSGQLRFGIAQAEPARLQSWPSQFHTKTLWHSVEDLKKKSQRHWAVERYLGYGEIESAEYPCKPATDLNEAVPRVLVLDDGGLGFREARNCWPDFLRGERPSELEWVVLKMSRPLACGQLWTTLMHDSWRERLIAIVSADQLRSEGLRVAGGLSWETTVDDIVEELELNRTLRGLRQSRHLVVTMRSDAALWLDGPGSSEPHCKLVFDRKRCEGEWQETNKDCKAYGFLSTITGSVAWDLERTLIAREDTTAKDKLSPDEIDLTVALASGLSTIRFLLEYGHGPAEKAPVFPFKKAADHLKAEVKKLEMTEAEKLEAIKQGENPEVAYTCAEVRCTDGRCQKGGPPLKAGEWTILGQVSPWHAKYEKESYAPARRVALQGPDRLGSVPCATFGKLQTFDRREIDSLRSLRRLMLMYKDSVNPKRPLCLGVFGAPGAGKSFGLKQIAEGVFGDKTPFLEFNLSQLRDSSDLIGPFHQVRDKVLSGATPVVFWDEFDSRKLDWLQYFLAPMQDGAFQEGQVTHSVGKSVFIFAGGTSHSFKEFNKGEESTFVDVKGPDFVSRLSGYLDIAGPNPRQDVPEDHADREYPVRRALVIRTTLELKDKPLEIERGLLTALLAVPKYCNGARSIDKLVSYIKDRGGMPLRRAYLPPDEILALHVGNENLAEFHLLARKYAEFYSQADRLAPIIHAEYLKSLAKLSPEERENKPNNKLWEELSADIKDSNVAAALRIPEILERAGLALVEGTETGVEMIEILNEKIETMAEAEHGGWEEHKRIDGWTYSPHRNDAALRHNLLLPYERLTDEVRGYDRAAVNNYPEIAHLAGYKIVPASEAKLA